MLFSRSDWSNEQKAKLQPHLLVFSLLSPHFGLRAPCKAATLAVLIIQDPGDAGSTFSCSSPCFGASLCCFSACHSCLESLFLLAVSAKYKRIAVLDLVSPPRRTKPHTHLLPAGKAPEGPNTYSDSVSCSSVPLLDLSLLQLVDGDFFFSTSVQVLGSNVFRSVFLRGFYFFFILRLKLSKLTVIVGQTSSNMDLNSILVLVFSYSSTYSHRLFDLAGKFLL